MNLTADDLWPLVLKLSHDEQVRLASLALHAARGGTADAVAYQTVPPGDEELSSDEDPLAWEAKGWEDRDTPR